MQVVRWNESGEPILHILLCHPIAVGWRRRLLDQRLRVELLTGIQSHFHALLHRGRRLRLDVTTGSVSWVTGGEHLH